MNDTANLRQSAQLHGRRGLLQAGCLSAVGLTLPRSCAAAAWASVSAAATMSVIRSRRGLIFVMLCPQPRIEEALG